MNRRANQNRSANPKAKENRKGKKSFAKGDERKRPARGNSASFRKGRTSSFSKSNDAERTEGESRPNSPSRFNDRAKTGRFSRRDSADAPKTPNYKPQKNKNDDGSMRLNRFLANAGICSRREADTYIEAGVVSVNGKVTTEMGVRVSHSDDVRFNGERITAEKKVYILLNKSKGYVTTLDDPHAEKTVMDQIKGACNERVYPVGRLDKATTGLLLFTNDGELTKKLTHPKHKKKKIYHAFLDKKMQKNDLMKLVEGFELEDGFTSADAAHYVDEDDKKQVGVEIHSGKNRIVRRMFAHVGYTVQKLDRVYFCGLTKKDLPRGKWRFLTQMEVNMLMMGK